MRNRRALFYIAFVVLLFFATSQVYASSLQKELEELQKDVEKKTKRIEELKQKIEKEKATSASEKTSNDIDLSKIKTQTTIKINDNTSIKIDNVSKKKEFVFDRYDDRYYYQDADKGTFFVTFNFSVTSKEKDPLLPSLYIGEVQGKNIVNITPFSVFFYKWSSHGCLLGLYHDSINDFAKKDTVRFVAAMQANDVGETMVVFTDKKDMYERTEEKYSRPAIKYVPKHAELSSKSLSFEEFTKTCTLIKLLK